MQRALPVAVKFLHKGNKELSRNMASYLSLAAIDYASLLTPHVQPIMDSIISGWALIFFVFSFLQSKPKCFLKEITHFVGFLPKYMKYLLNLSKGMPWLWSLSCSIVIIKKNYHCFICFHLWRRTILL